MKTLKLQRVARYFGYIVLVAILFSACSEFDSPADKFEKLIPPIILVAESKDGAITVCDSKNQYVTIGQEFYLAQVISDSYEKRRYFAVFKWQLTFYAIRSVGFRSGYLSHVTELN